MLETCLAPLRWPLEAASLLFALAAILYPLTQWASLPGQIPCHYGLSGRPDRWGGRWTLVLMIVMTAGLYAGLSVSDRSLALIGGAEDEFTRREATLLCLKTGVSAAFAYIIWVTVRVAQKRAEKASVLVICAILAAMVLPLLLLKGR